MVLVRQTTLSLDTKIPATPTGELFAIWLSRPQVIHAKLLRSHSRTPSRWRFSSHPTSFACLAVISAASFMTVTLTTSLLSGVDARLQFAFKSMQIDVDLPLIPRAGRF